MKESTMTEKEYNKRMSAYCRLLSSPSVLSSERNGVRSATTRSVQMVDDLSRPDELKKGDTPAVVVYADDRLSSCLLLGSHWFLTRKLTPLLSRATRQRTRLVLRKTNRNGLLQKAQ